MQVLRYPSFAYFTKYHEIAFSFSQPQFPPSATVYDYFVDPKKLDWEPWEPKVAPFRYIKTMPFHKMIVPTVDTVRKISHQEVLMRVWKLLNRRQHMFEVALKYLCNADEISNLLTEPQLPQCYVSHAQWWVIS